ncbi:MAG: hypothetical protein J6R07_00945 [Bacteroidaceae bacterium]|nr:hypothetical protein [Bacteroidaceae bacterium]
MYKRIFIIIAFLLTVTCSHADNGSNSPYTRYGVGLLSDQSLGINRQMGGLGYGLRSHRFINILNPASFAQADTLTMLFEAGFSLQNVNFKENGKSVNARNASFDYVAIQFRLCKNLGMSAGFLPYSSVGYSFSNVSNKGTNEESTDNYSGSGGIYQPYIGLGWQPFKWFSAGVMGSYIYGDITHEVGIDFLNSTDRTRSYNVSLKSYKVDFGLQFAAKMGKKHDLVIGATYSLGHDLNAKTLITEVTTDSTTTEKTGSGFNLPHTYGAGFAYTFNDEWKIGADYTLQQWSSSSFFGIDKGIDRSKISAGVEYSPTALSNNIFKMMSYRAGFYYAQPYTELNGKKGCEEYGVSAGISLPFLNNNNRTSHATLHLSGQFIHMKPKSAGMIRENYFRINLGITFNESWFMIMQVR